MTADAAYRQPAGTMPYELIKPATGGTVKAWTHGVAFEPGARAQVANVASLPFVHRWVAVMPDVHVGRGATIGTVIPTVGAVIPAAVGVDIGCGMMAQKTTLKAGDLPDNLFKIRTAIERAVPHGDQGWNRPAMPVYEAWAPLDTTFRDLCRKHPHLERANSVVHLGTLGGGNHFIELCLDEQDAVWVMLHSGSRGIGNRIGTYFIEMARQDMRRHHRNLPDQDLAYLEEGTKHFDDYVQAVGWAQQFAAQNRRLMMEAVMAALTTDRRLPAFDRLEQAVNCHHNYVAREHHFGKDVFLTRKGAVSARAGELGIIPGSMGAQSFIVRGRGNPDSFHSCSHGAGRLLSRTQAKARYTVADHAAATRHVECRKDAQVVDETPAAYKPIDAVMNAQRDLVEVVHTLRQVVCVKG